MEMLEDSEWVDMFSPPREEYMINKLPLFLKYAFKRFGVYTF